VTNDGQAYICQPPPARRTLWAWTVATFFGAGFGKPGPGTWGSVAAVLLWAGYAWAFHPAPNTLLVALLIGIALTLILGVPAATIDGIADDTGLSPSDGITSDGMLVFRGTAAPGATVTLSRVDTGAIGSAVADGTGHWTFDYTATPLADRYYAFQATVDLGAAVGAALEAKGLEKGLDAGALDWEKRSESTEQPANQTPINPVKATRTALRRLKNAANSVIGPTHPYATQLSRSLVRTS